MNNTTILFGHSIVHKYALNQSFNLNGVFCTIDILDVIGNTSHYGFTWKSDNGNYYRGLMPVDFVDKFSIRALRELVK